ncbi:histidine kinase dimerization/phosphoacceptor domain -containing protein [Solidesulfovibrio fructosivorans]|nr:histidine kinase dimerization/phosphoacceptor domain -containing protein [Solidesulfovibrio fructosivorans]
MGKVRHGPWQWFLNRSIATILTGIVLLAALPAMGVIVASSFEARHQAELRAWDDIRNLTRSLIALQRGVLRQARGVLVALDHTEEVRGRRLAACNRLFTNLLRDHPELSNVFLTDASGTVVASGLPAFLGVNLADRKYFQEAMTTRGLGVSKFIYGRATKKPILVFALPRMDADGRLLGVIGMSYYLEGYDKFLKRIELPENSRITLLDPDGLRMVAYPPTELFPMGGRLVPRLWAQLAAETADEGTFIAPRYTGGDGLFSFTRLRLAPGEPPYMTILVSAACYDVFADADKQLRRGLLSALIATLLALVIARVAGRAALGRGIASLVDAAERLAGGDLLARDKAAETGSLEVRRLGASFNAMAETIELRERELMETAAALGRMRAMLSNILESMPSAIIGIDPAGRVTHINGNARELFGLDAEDALGREVGASLPQLSGYMPNVETALRERRSQVVEKQLLPQHGAPHLMNMLFYPLVANGAEGVVIRLDDVTESERIREAVEKALVDKSILLKEIHHRVKNNLQIILSFISLQADEAADPAERERLLLLGARIRSMALVHQQLYNRGDAATVDMGEYVRSLAQGVLSVFKEHTAGVRLVCDARPFPLSLNAAVPCGLLLTELITNACKHAFFPGESGELRVGCRLENGQARFWVEDTGRGVPEGFDHTALATMGMTLVRELARQLEGEVRIAQSPEGGARFEIAFPA